MIAAVFVAVTHAQDPFAAPKSVDERLKVELVAEQPEITTPTGIDVDETGRVIVIENNTHFRPADYPRHPTDRVLILSDTQGNARADNVIQFADGFTFAMSVAVKPTWVRLIEERVSGKADPVAEAKAVQSGSKRPLEVYVATRSEIVLCRDVDHDGKCDEKKRIVHLETKGNYPHNGLAGFAFEASGYLYFGFGENLGETYKIIGSDGVTLTSAEAGNMYRCWPDGTKLEQWARGFWNPHASCFDARGVLYTVDNDPDSRPPCRLLHVVRDGDYGYRFRNGRKGLHPFTSWNGEVPNMLPMAAGTGEAPSGILAYESDALPDEYHNNLLCTSWGDHRIDRFRMQYKEGHATYESVLEPLIVGGENFRPVGIACAPDGSLFVSDWVLRDYKLHGKGRVWKISPVKQRSTPAVLVTQISAPTSSQQLLETLKSPRRDVRRTALQRALHAGHRDWVLSGFDADQDVLKANDYRVFRELCFGIAEGEPSLFASLQDGWKVVASIAGLEHPFQIALATRRFARVDVPEKFLQEKFGPVDVKLPSPKGIKLLAASLARSKHPQSKVLAEAMLRDAIPEVQQLGVIWVAEEKFLELRPQVEELLKNQLLTPALFQTILAALDMLDGKSPTEFDKNGAARYALPLLADASRPFNVRLMALRAIPVSDPGLKPDILKKLFEDKNNPLAMRAEALLSLQLSSADSSEYFRSIVANRDESLSLKAAALAALSTVAVNDDLQGPSRAVVIQQLASQEPVILNEALRGARQLKASSDLDQALIQAATTAKKLNRREIGEQVALLVKATKRDLPAEVKDFAKEIANPNWKPLEATATESRDESLQRTTFFHPTGPGCFKCHTLNGRGGKIGPDLSTIGASRNRDQLREAILKPSQEVAPQFTTWSIETHQGQVFTGMIVHENEGKTILGTADGKTIELKTIDIAERIPQKVSVMPEKLHEQMTPSELSELIELLRPLK